MTLVDLSFGQLLLCVGFVCIAGVASIVMKLRLEKDLFWGTIRTFAQLYLVGYVLQFVFRINDLRIIVLLYTWMIFWAAQAIRSRVGEKAIPTFVPVFASMVISYMAVLWTVTAVIIRVDPWYAPQYFIPIGGMIIGNSMNAIAIALDRLFGDLRKRRDEVEVMLCLGATREEATATMLGDAIRAGMIPSINSLMTVGLVSLPGMMTGQILAGADPMTSIRYQIVVMLMLTASASLGCVAVGIVIRRLCFTQYHQLRL